MIGSPMEIYILKFLHFLSIFIAGGIGIGGAVVQSVHLKAKQPPTPLVGRSMQILGIMGLGSLIVLWITGLALHGLIYQGAYLGTAFAVKLIGATVLLLMSIIGNTHIYKSSKNKTPLNLKLMKPITSIGRIALIFVLAGAVVTFNN